MMIWKCQGILNRFCKVAPFALDLQMQICKAFQGASASTPLVFQVIRLQGNMRDHLANNTFHLLPFWITKQSQKNWHYAWKNNNIAIHELYNLHDGHRVPRTCFEWLFHWKYVRFFLVSRCIYSPTQLVIQLIRLQKSVYTQNHITHIICCHSDKAGPNNMLP